MISFVIPVYNVDIELLWRSINSILKSDENDIEIVVVDDGSRDSSSSKYKKLCDSDDRIKYYRKENEGPSSARNFGVEKAEKEYVSFLDADDYITGDCIAKAKDIIWKEHPDLVMGYVYKDIHDEESSKCRAFSDVDKSRIIVIDDDNSKAKLLNHILGYPDQTLIEKQGYISDGPCCRFFRRKLFKDTYFDVIPKWNEDTLWNISLIKKCSKIVVCKSIWYVYVVRSGSITQGYRPNCYDEFIYITNQVCSQSDWLWKKMIEKGVYHRIWHDIFILSRAYIFNKKNHDNFLVKYRIMKKAIKSDCYQIAIENIDFKCEHRFARRKVKEILNYSMKKHRYLFSYLILMVYSYAG